MKKSCLLLIAIFVLNIANAQWQQCKGPYGSGGYKLVVNGDTLFKIHNSVVYRSFDNGLNWINVGSGLPSFATGISDIAMSGSNIYIITSALSIELGMYYSSDYGTNWIKINNGISDSSFTTLTVKGDSIYAGTLHGSLFLSTDHGTNWTQVYQFVGPSCSSYGINCISKYGSIMFVGTQCRSYLSLNNGQTWSIQNFGYTNYNNSVPSYSFTMKGTEMYVTTTAYGVLHSSNYGTTWSTLSNGFPANLSVSNIVSNDTNVFIIVSLNTIYQRVYKLYNNDTTWYAINADSLNINVYSLSIINNNIYACTNAGVFLSTNNGLSWVERNKGLDFRQVNALAENTTKIFAGTSYGLYYCYINDTTWNLIKNGLSSNTCVNSIEKYDDTTFFIGTNGVYKSSDNGFSWVAKNNGLVDNNGNIVSVISLKIIGSNMIAGTFQKGMYISTNYGSSWVKITNGIYTNATIYSITLKGTSIFAYSYNKIYCSTDNGINWTELITSGLPSAHCTASLISDSNIYTGGYSIGIYKSKNNGLNWSHLNTGIWLHDVVTLYKSDSIYFTGTQGQGVFCSINNDTTWNDLNLGLINGTVTSFAKIGSNIYIGTNKGVWKRSFNICFPPSVSSKYFISSNISNTSMTIGWTRGNGDSVLVVARKKSTQYGYPFYGYSYTANSVFGLGSQLGVDNYVVYKGVDTLVNITGLTTDTTYTFNIYEYNSTDFCYRTPFLIGDATTTVCNPAIITTQPSNQTTCNPSSNTIFSVVANSSTPIIYNWQYKNNGNWMNVTNGVPSGSIYNQNTSSSLNISGINIFGSYLYRCCITNCYNTNTIYSDSVTLFYIPLPSSAGTISGVTTVCQGQNSLSYLVPSIANAASYIWSLPNGVTGTSSTNNIIVNYGNIASSGDIKVRGYNACGVGDSSLLAITVNPLPSPASNISGTTSVCNGQNNVNYTVPLIINATSYIWNLPNGVTGSSTTNNITVNYGASATSDVIKVRGSNVCGTGDSSTLAITVNTLPANAGAISGLFYVCQGQNSVLYSVPQINYATNYIWTLPNGATGVSNTNNIFVNFSNIAHTSTLSVNGNNVCGNGLVSSQNIIIFNLPTTPNLISGNTIVTKGQQNVVYTVPTVAGANSYTWGLPIGANGISNSNSINVSYSSFAQSGTIKVKAHNNCGDGNYSYLPITVQNNIGSGIGLPYNAISLFPSPATYSATIMYTLKINQTINIWVYDIMGRKIKELINTHQQSGTYQLTLDVSELTEGIYFLKTEGEENFETVKFSVMH